MNIISECLNELTHLALADLRLGDEDEPRRLLHHHNLGLEIGVQARVVHEAAQAAALSCGIDTEELM